MGHKFNASREDFRSLMSKMLEVRQSVRLFFEYFFDWELQSLAVLKLKIRTFYMGHKIHEVWKNLSELYLV